MWMRCFFSLAAFALAAAAADRPDFNGTWSLDASRSQFGEDKLKSATLEIRQTGDSIQIVEALTDPDGKERKLDIQCNTLGKECKTKDEQVSIWYNGPMLVLMETRRGNEVVLKRRLKRSDDGKTLSVEVMHIAPPGAKNEVYAFNRQL
jgi:hypothetical protein